MSYSSDRAKLPRVVLVGPGPKQVGGLATFLDILLFSDYLKERYELIHLDTTRGKRGEGIASRFALINLVYFLRQSMILFWILLTRRPQILHLPLTSYWAFWKDTAFVILARILGVKVVAHLHGGLFDQYYRESQPLVQRLIGWSMSQANVVVALSERWKCFLLEEVRPNLRVEVVPNSVDRMFARQAEMGNKPKSEENIILFVGGLGHRKGVFDILKAIPAVAASQPSAYFIFAGQEESRGEWVKIETVCSENDLTNKVEFPGFVTGQAKLDLFLRAAVFLLPSYGENLPYSLLEAMSMGVPVITTPVGAIPEIVEEGINGFLIQPGDTQALAEKILLLLGDPGRRAAICRANIEKIKKDYLPETAMLRFDAIYRNLLEENEQSVWKKIAE
jgi:glycosyltransferase involved in cell wall biosynthesis